MPARRRPGRTVAVGTAKGGGKKTTTVLGLAEALSDQGLSVAVVDLDDGATATEILEPADPDAAGSKELLDPSLDLTLEQCLTETGWPGVYLCQAEGALINRLRDLEASSEDLRWLRPRFAAPHVDVVLIDTPPTSSWLGLAGLVAADHLVTPVQPTLVYVRRAIQLVDVVVPAARQHNRGLHVAGMIVTGFNDVAEERRVLDLLADKYGDQAVSPDGLIWDPYIRTTTSVQTTYESTHARLRDVGNRHARRTAQAYDVHAAHLLSIIAPTS